MRVNGHQLTDRAVGALAGAAVGDALGGATEGWESHEIREHCGGWVEGVIQSMRHQKNMLKPFSPFWKGDGHVTDDTLMTRVLVQAYATKRDHLDAYDVESLVVPAIVDEATWIPELDREDLLYHRLFLAEKWLVLKLRYGHADPRDAGVGNIVNCGAAMYIAPVGIANACAPDARVRRGDRPDGRTPVELRAGGRRRACRSGRRSDAPGRDPRLRVSTSRSGSPRTRRGRRSRRSRTPRARSTAGGTAGSRHCVPPSRRSTRSASTTRDRRRTRASRAACTRSRRCRSRSGCCSRRNGDYTETMLGGVNYGRDSDSIASMGGAIAAALGSPVPREWIDEIGAASKLDLEEPGRTMAEVAEEIFAKDRARFEARAAAFGTEAPV